MALAKNIEFPHPQLSANEDNENAISPGEAGCQKFLLIPNLHPMIQSFPLPTIAHWCRLEVLTQEWEIGDTEMSIPLAWFACMADVHS